MTFVFMLLASIFLWCKEEIPFGF